MSSTGHLILVSHFLGLQGEALKTFEVVIQGGALLAVVGLYRGRVLQLLRGLIGKDPDGLRLCINLLLSFLPVAVTGLLMHDWIKAHLFTPWPVVGALAAGGVVMLLTDAWSGKKPPGTRSLDSLKPNEAALIGLVQCLALWPGASRAMVTIVAGLLCGLPAAAAAEYSFLLALPTLGAAVALDGVSNGAELWHAFDGLPIALGVATASVVAALAMRGFVRYLGRHGLSLFGWYRLALAALVGLTVFSAGKGGHF